MTERDAPQLLAIGRALVDFYPETDGPLTDVRRYRSAVGGSPANVAIAASTLGVRTALVARVGDDPLGAFVRAELSRLGVDTTDVLGVTGVTTPVAVCEIDPPDRFPLTFLRPEPPADLQIQGGDLDRGRVVGAGILWASLSGLSGEPARTAVMESFAARAGRRHTVLDLDYRASFWSSAAVAGAAARAALPLATVAVGNLEECRIALGLDADPTADEAATALLDAGVDLAIVKLGEHGVLGATRSMRLHVAPVPVTVVNGLGAGDAFGGALCAGLIDDRPLADVLRFANAAGAMVASRRGASEAMPTRAEVEGLLAASRA